ncbi:MAG: hypothetical protein H6585_11700 [Flavobacteriales bacterium]|nr:hypothetical protein [Flavobacteriales bacterium]MCB9448994.1 hypothetical protein [Flavobacteriales bacterium]
MKSTLVIFIIGLLCLAGVNRYVWRDHDTEGHMRIVASDGKGYYKYLPDIFLSHTFGEEAPDERFIYDVNGQGVIKYPAGTAMAMLPFFGAGYIMARLSHLEEDGYSDPYQKAIGIGGIFYFLLGLFSLDRLLQLYRMRTLTRIAVLIFMAVGTNLLAYATLHPSWSHIYSWCFVAVFLYHSKKGMTTGGERYLYYAALWWSIVVLIRPVNGVVLLALPFLAESAHNLKQRISGIRLRHVLLTGIIVFAIGSIQMGLWHYQSGQWIVWSYPNEGFDWLHPAPFRVLFGLRKGLFIYTPLLLLSVCGTWLWMKRNRFEAINLAVFFLAITYVISS